MSTMKPVEALMFLHSWREELLKLYDDFREDGQLVDREAMSSQHNTPNPTPMKTKPNILAPNKDNGSSTTLGTKPALMFSLCFFAPPHDVFNDGLLLCCFLSS